MKKAFLLLIFLVVIGSFLAYQSFKNSEKNDTQKTLEPGVLTASEADGFGPPTTILSDSSGNEICWGSLDSWTSGDSSEETTHIETILQQHNCKLFGENEVYPNVTKYHFNRVDTGYIIDAPESISHKVLKAQFINGGSFSSGDSIDDRSNQTQFEIVDLFTLDNGEKIIGTSPNAQFFITQDCTIVCESFSVRDKNGVLLLGGIDGIRNSTEGYTGVVYDPINTGFIFTTSRTSENQSNYTYTYLSLNKTPYKVFNLGIIGPVETIGGEGETCLSKHAFQFDKKSVTISCRDEEKSFSLSSV